MAKIKVQVECANGQFHHYEFDDEIPECHVDANSDNGTLKVIYIDRDNKPAAMFYNKNVWLTVETKYN